MTKNFTSIFSKILVVALVLTIALSQVSHAAAQSSDPPKPETVTLQGKTVLKGFDPEEFGGNDSACTRTELESIHIGEVVSSPNEKCLVVVEWSLKNGEETVLTGVHALPPGEWYYVPLAVGGYNDQVRVVGTLWYLPKGWNSHQYAIDIAKDRDARDATESIVGLSPTDRWVVWQIDQLGAGSATTPIEMATIVPLVATATPPATLAFTPTPSVEASVTPGAALQPTATADPLVIPISGEVNKLNLMGWIIGALVLAVLFLAFRRPSAPVETVAPKATAPRRKPKPATKKKSTKK